MKEKGIKKLLLLAFFASGVAALIYEVLWMRKLSLLFGTTLYGTTTILTVFMAGLGLGSLVFGRLVDKLKRSLLLYGLLELGIGAYAAATPWIFKLVEKVELLLFRTPPQNFFSFHLVQFVLAILALIIPTLLMGGTLPVIGKFFVGYLAETGKQIGILYFINTLGAVLGTLLAAFVFINLLGVDQTIYFAAVINILIGMGVLVLGFRVSAFAKTSAGKQGLGVREKGEREKTRGWVLLGAYFLSGLAALSLEVSWTRVLTMILGSSIYAFALMLSAFLFGIALGSVVMARFVDRLRRPLLAFILVEVLIGLLVLITIPVFPKLPFIFLKFYRLRGGNFNQLQIFEFSLTFAVMFGPTFFMGVALPIVNRLAAGHLETLGSSVGAVYFANTAGSTLGPVLAGFLLIPTFGLQKSILIAAFIYLAAGFILILNAFTRTAVKVSAASFLVIIAGASFLIPSWNKNILNSGVYIYANQYLQQDPHLLAVTNEQLFYEEGLSTTVAVEKIKEGHLILTTDGKADAGTKRDMDTELLSGHLPMLLHQKPEEVLVIGLGSGITLGAIEQYEELKEVDMVEIEPAVVEAAAYFSEYNNQALKDPRLNLIIGDGRNYVLMTDKKYDVITAEPSNPWMTGNANLFTKEQYELYKKRLKPGGIMFQWGHIYKLKPDDVKTIVATFQEVFPHTTLWQNFSGRDIFLVGSEEPLKIDLAASQEKMGQEKIKKDLARVYLDDPLMLLSYSVLNEEGVRAFYHGAQIHTDNYPVLEFQAPKGIFLKPEMTESANLEALEQARTNVFTLLKDFDDPAIEEKMANYILARTHIIQGEIYFSKGEVTEKGITEYEKALTLIPDNVLAKERLAEVFFLQGETYFANNLYKEAEESCLEAVKWDPDSPDYYQSLARIYLRQGNGEGAIKAYERALEMEPDDINSRLELGILYGKKGLLERAESEFRRVLELDQENYFAHNNLANVYELKGDKERAIEELEASLRINSNQPEIKKRLEKIKTGP